MVRVGVVGCGKIAEKHLSAYRRLDGVEVVVTDIVEKGRAIADRYGAGWHPGPEELIAGDAVDAVDVCTPTPSHAELILHALAHGKHVFCEKPLARDPEEGAAIKEAAERSGLVVMAGYLYRYHPALRFAREVVRGGVIGDPYLATLRLGGRGSHKAWKHLRDTGGGAGNEVLVHLLDLACWYFGEVAGVERLHAETVLADREIEGQQVRADAEDLVLVKLEMRSGVRVLCQADLVTPGYMNHVEVQGTNGSLFTSILDYLPTTVYCKEPRGIYDRGHTFQEFPKVDLFAHELGDFLACVRGGDRGAIHSVEDSLRVMRIVDAARSVAVG